MVVTVGDWVVQVIDDDDGHLTVSISHGDGTKVNQIEEDLGDGLDWCDRFTTEGIENKHWHQLCGDCGSGPQNRTDITSIADHGRCFNCHKKWQHGEEQEER